MEQYISKSTLMAEIESLKEENKPNSKSISEYIKGGIYGFDLAIEKTLGIIDALEVKEVDLDKELDSLIIPELKKYKALPSLIDVAKHFFELGLKSQKGEEV